MIVNQRGLADVFGVSIETIVRWTKEGMPVLQARKGRHGSQYDTAAVYQWRLARERAAANPGAVDLEDAKTRLAVAQADRYEIENAESRGDLLRRSAVVEEYTRRVVESRAILLGGPTKLAPIVVAERDLAGVKRILEDWVYESLGRLCEPGDTVRRDMESVPTAAAVVGEPVGGPGAASQSRGKRGARPVANG